MTAQRISATNFLSLHNANQLGDSVVLDIRSPAEVQRESIGGCVCLPLQQLDEASLRAQVAAENSCKVYLLCQSGMRADMAVRQLGQLPGIEWVIVDGGLNGIKNAGGAVTRGERNTLPLERQVRIAAGLVIVSGVALGYALNPVFYAVSGAVGAGLIFAGITDRCGLAFLLARMPWNT
ncbi:rhodanese-like domain-containing protein [Teredinibacter turnerae]|uniref:rhodanese-like domain-containing protein n=1 Tax=Teredinibacter turnerae TaxID=2426 RepID=UPI0003791A80|nr:rhodanese-like domain-containing protein [Teredinibacter turnerae]